MTLVKAKLKGQRLSNTSSHSFHDDFQICTLDHWSQQTFNELASFKNHVHAHSTTAPRLDESASDFALFFHPDSPFSHKNEWCFWYVKDSQDQVLARWGATRPRPEYRPSDWKEVFLSTGFYETHESDLGLRAARAILPWIKAWANHRGIPELRLPLQGGFFGNYRAKVPNETLDFYGEPDTLPRYFEEWKQLGFEVCGEWSTFEVQTEPTIRGLEALLTRFYGKPEIPNVRLRPVDRSRWSDEMRIVLKIFLDSYKKMPEYMPISEEEFLHLYDSFKHLVHPELCFIAEGPEGPMAFLLTHFDPGPAITRTRWFLNHLPFLGKLLLYPKIRLERGRLLIPYGGKLSNTEGEIKGVLAALILQVLRNVRKTHPVSYWAYVANGSPTLKTLQPGTFKVHSKYQVFKTSAASQP